MPMRLKIVAILLAIASAVFVADTIIEQLVVLPRFLALERREAARNVERVRRAVDSDLSQLARSARDYARWDEACRFVEGRDPGFSQRNLPPSAFPTLHVNLIRFYDAGGRFVWGQTRDAETGELIAIDGLASAGIPGRLLYASWDPPRPKRGLLQVGGELMMLAVEPVLASSEEGPVRGTAIFGRLLLTDEMEKLRAQTSVDFDLIPSGAAPPRPAGRAEENGGDVWFSDAEPDVLRAYGPLAGLDGRPVRAIRVDLPREFTAEGLDVIVRERWWLLGASLCLLAAAYFSFGRLVVRPLHQLVEHVAWIRQSGDLDRRLQIEGRDEVARLAREFDLLLAQLGRSRTARLRSENRFKSILQDQTELIRRFLPDGTTTYVNRAYARYFNVSEDGVVGKRPDWGVPEEDRALVESHLEGLCMAEPTGEVEHRVTLGTGEVRWLHWTTRAIFDESGKLVEFQSEGREVTERAPAPAGEQDTGATG